MMKLHSGLKKLGLTFLFLAGLTILVINTGYVRANDDIDIKVDESLGEVTISIEVNVSDIEFSKNNDGQAVISYVGPENDSEVRDYCNEFFWSDIQARSKDVPVEIVNGNLVSLKLEHSVNLTNDYGYCFKSDLLINDQTIPFFKIHKISSGNEPRVKKEGFKFTTTTILEGTYVPGTITVTTVEDVTINPSSWQYALFDSENQCGLDSEVVEFVNIDNATQTQAKVNLTKEADGKVVCFRGIAESDENDEEYIYDLYEIEKLEVVDEDGTNWLLILGIIILFILITIVVLKKKKK